MDMIQPGESELREEKWLISRRKTALGRGVELHETGLGFQLLAHDSLDGAD